MTETKSFEKSKILIHMYIYTGMHSSFSPYSRSTAPVFCGSFGSTCLRLCIPLVNSSHSEEQSLTSSEVMTVHREIQSFQYGRHFNAASACMCK